MKYVYFFGSFVCLFVSSLHINSSRFEAISIITLIVELLHMVQNLSTHSLMGVRGRKLSFVCAYTPLPHGGNGSTKIRMVHGVSNNRVVSEGHGVSNNRVVSEGHGVSNNRVV